MKKIISIIVSVLMVMTLAISFAACDKGTDNGGQNNNNNNNNEPTGTVDLTISETALKNIVGSGKIYTTTVGQADLAVINNLVERAGVTTDNYTSNNLLTAADVENGSTVIIAVGASGKGLGGAGTDTTKELARAKEFTAKAANINIVCVHVGGTSRRGETSDPTIKEIAAHSKVMLVVETGNADGLFNTLSTDNTVPLYLYTKASKMLDSFKYLLGK